MSNAVAIAATVVLSLALILGIIALAIPYWEVTDPSTTINDNIVRHAGLWLQCLSYSTGNWHCDDYNTFFAALPARLQVARGLIIASFVLGILAITLTIATPTLSACNIAGSNYVQVYLLAAAGSVSILAGACMLAAPSWYAKHLYDEYYYQFYRANGNMQNAGQVMVFGSALFVAWSSGAVFVLAAILSFAAICCITTKRSEPYTYRNERINTVNKSMTEYV